VNYGPISVDIAAPEIAAQIGKVTHALLLPANKDLRLLVFSGAQAGPQNRIICMQTAQLLADSFGYGVCVLDAESEEPLLTDMGWQLEEKRGRGLFRGQERSSHTVEGLWLLGKEQVATYLKADSAPEVLRLQMEQLRAFFDFVLICAPRLSETRGSALASQADGVLLVVEAGSVRRQTLNQLKRTLDRVNGHLIGTVLTNRVFPIPEWIFRWFRL
jgi:hypothetical protein